MTKPKLTDITQAGAENLVCLSEKFHTHPRYHDFYKRYCDEIHGFTGCYDLVIRMAESLTDWEENRGGKELYDNTEVIWDDLAGRYVDKFFETALVKDHLPNAEVVFKAVEPRADHSRRQLKALASNKTKEGLKP